MGQVASLRGFKRNHVAALHSVAVPVGIGINRNAEFWTGFELDKAEITEAGMEPGVVVERFDIFKDGDLLHLMVENAHQSGLGAHPHLMADVLRRHRIECPAKLDAAIAVH